MKYSLLIFCLLLVISSTAQDLRPPLEGEVSYVTSRNVYVKFDRTDAITIGDTLQLRGTPCLLVSNKSSSSCVCVPLANCSVVKGDKVQFIPNRIAIPAEPIAPVVPKEEDSEAEPVSEIVDPESPFKQKIRGRLSVASYNNIASDRDNRNRFMGRLSLNADHLNNSRFSFETYLNYRHLVPANPAEFKPRTRYFNVFNLAVKYELDPGFTFVLGRRINPRTASLGAIDGLQVEKQLGPLYVGAIVGSRPDIQDFSLNLNLMQYGAYVGAETQTKQFYSQTTLGLIEQRNSGNIDRRYAYFQHSSTIASKLSLFSSAELDVYAAVNGVASTTLRVPNLYVSGTYRFNRKVNLMLSYDSRKRILYYDTFQTEIERMLDDDLARQGIRLRLNVRPVNNLSLGGSYSKRFQTDTTNKSDNLNGFAYLSRLPGIGGRLSLTYNYNRSNYLTSHIYAARYSRNLLDGKLNADFYYRMANYFYVNSEQARRQHYYGTNLSMTVAPKLVLSLSGEMSTFNQETNFRIYARIIKRFTGKK